MSVEVITDETFEEVLNSNEKVIVKYYADWCGSCKLFAPKFRRLSDSEDYQDIKFIDVNAEQNEKARKMAAVDNLPFFAVFKNGKKLDGSPTSKEEVVREMIEKLN